MTLPTDLGGQTATVIERLRAQHNRRVDGESQTWPGCSFQLDDGPVEALSDERQQDTLRGTLFAPPGCRATGSSACIVEPGPLDGDGQPLRMAFDGPAQPRWDDEGTEDHVVVRLRSIRPS